MARSFRIARTALICLAFCSFAGIAISQDDKDKTAKQEKQGNVAPEGEQSERKPAQQESEPKEANPATPPQLPPESTGAHTAAAKTPPAYVIGPEDQLLVKVWREPELSGPVNVRPDGKITMQLLGEVQASGLTPEVLADQIRDGLSKEYMKDPQVTVTVTQIHSKKYIIVGEVNRPGPYPLLTPTTVFEALGLAGGFREFAKQTKIYVMRKGQRFPFNYKDVVKGKKMDQNIVLESGDTIIVP